MNRRIGSIGSIALAFGAVALAGVFSTAIRPAGLPALSYDLRFYGASRAIGDLLWIKTAQRVASSSRVTSSEAFRNFRTIRIAAELHPNYPEPYLCGIIAMCMWRRNDLAVELIREGIEKFPTNRHIRFAAFGVVTVFGVPLASILQEVPALEILTEEAARSSGYLEANEIVALFWTAKARSLEADGLAEEALALWKKIRAEYSYHPGILESAEGAIARMEEEGRRLDQRNP